MIREMQEKLSREIEQLSHELTVTLPQAIAQAVELGDLRENSEYKAALERQQFVQARLGQLHRASSSWASSPTTNRRPTGWAWAPGSPCSISRPAKPMSIW
jgi:transcription elongation factor GreA